MNDLIIIGGGPAGVAAGVYAGRKKLKTVFITESFGGQSVESVSIENWIGTRKIAGQDFAKMLEEHLRATAGDSVEIITNDRVIKIENNNSEEFKIETEQKRFYMSRTILIASGSSRKKLDIPGAREFENKGITYCASCDGPLFAGKDVAVIGGGNAGFETAAQLLAYAKSVTLLNRSNVFKADEITVEKVLSNPKMRALKNAVPKEIKGKNFVEKLIFEESGMIKELEVEGIFVEIGLIPNTGLVKDLIQLNKYGQIPINPRNQRTEIRGIWAAGDVTDGLFHQNNIAAGDGVKALEDIYLFLHAGK